MTPLNPAYRRRSVAASVVATTLLSLGTAARSNESYCGIHCVYSALRLLYPEHDVSFDSLLDPKYLGSVRGSTMQELQRAIEDCGGNAAAVGGMTSTMLQQSPYPLILHVKGNRSAVNYNHWILYLGMEGGRARLFDPPGRFHVASIAEILTIWDGTALAVSRTPVDMSVIARPYYTRAAVVIAVGAVIVVLLKAAEARFSPRNIAHRVAMQVGLLLLVAAAAGFAIHGCDRSEGFLHNLSQCDASDSRKPLYRIESGDGFVQHAAGAVELMVRVVLGCVWINSAVGHFANHWYFLFSVYRYDIVSARVALFVALVIPSLEGALGICLIGKVCVVGAYLLSAAALGLFVTAQAIVVVRGDTVACGCRSAGVDGAVGTVSVAVTSALLLAALYGSVYSLARYRDRCAGQKYRR